jgi:hypothetical protein
MKQEGLDETPVVVRPAGFYGMDEMLPQSN